MQLPSPCVLGSDHLHARQSLNDHFQVSPDTLLVSEPLPLQGWSLALENTETRLLSASSGEDIREGAEHRKYSAEVASGLG